MTEAEKTPQENRDLPVPVEVFQSMERRDEQQVLAEMRGEILEEFVYQIEVNGRKVTNLSYAGVKEAIRRRGRVENLEVRTEETDEEIRAIVRVRDHENCIDVVGASTAEKGKPFAYTLAVNKAERNAFAKLIPAKWIAVLIQEWLGKHRQKPQGQPASTPEAARAPTPTAPDGSREIEIKSSRGNAVLASLSVSPDGKEAVLTPKIPVPVTDSAYAYFLEPKVLTPLKEKSGFTLDIFQEDAKLVAIHFKGLLDEPHIREISNAVRWTFEKVAERKPQ